MTDFATFFGPLAEHSRVVYFAYDLDARRVTYVSPAYERVLGSKAEQVNEQLPAWQELIHPDDYEYLIERLSQALTGELIEDLEIRLRYPDGTRQWLCLTATRVAAPDGRAYLSGTVHDITQVKRYMDNAHRYNAKKNATLEILSHDLAGPLIMVQQLADHVADQSKEYADESLNELVRLMRMTCQESVDLIRDFVDHEFMESANVVLKRERLDLVEWMRTIIVEYQRNADKLNKHMIYVPFQEPVYAHIDKNKFEQVINNLVSNALKFTHDGGRIELAVERHNGYARISVTDNGIGIPEKFQPLLFDKFTKARRPGLRGEKTTGLGMSVIKTIVGLHNGAISFESVEHQGSRFVIDIPAPNSEQPDAPDHRQPTGW